MAENQVQEPRDAASVILLREGESGVEVYLLRRHRKASFMASSYVFPGGMADEGETDLRMTAARELFEEAGVLLSSAAHSTEDRESWRRKVNVDKVDFREAIGDLPIDVEGMHYFAHWITPSVEKRRYSAKFFVAVMPEGQSASPDNKETVDEVWVTPAEALERSRELHLPPPQLRTFYELVEPARDGIEGIMRAAKAGAAHPHPILPRMSTAASTLTLLMPWDQDYEDKGHGASHSMPADHPLAVGPTRFVLDDGAWRHTRADE